MTESELIWKFLELEFHNEHPAIYLYCCGQFQGQESAIETLMKLLTKFFGPSYEEFYLKKIVKSFLENKKNLYKKGLIKVKSKYG